MIHVSCKLLNNTPNHYLISQLAKVLCIFSDTTETPIGSKSWYSYNTEYLLTETEDIDR